MTSTSFYSKCIKISLSLVVIYLVPACHCTRDSRKSRQKIAKITANFCENRKKLRQSQSIKLWVQRPL